MIDIVTLYKIVMAVASLVLVGLGITFLIKAIRLIDSWRVVSERCERLTDFRGVLDWVKSFRRAKK